MKIHGINKLTLLDYPGHIACLIFTGACNMRCPFCHNATLVLAPDSQPVLSEDEIFSFLESRKNILEGICISGGEPTLQPDLTVFIRKVKDLGFKVKLDTNGTNSSMLYELLHENLLDYVSIDIKNSKEKYGATTGVPNCNLASIESSVQILMDSPIDYEFRTTLVREFHTKDDLLAIGHWLNGAKNYYLQSFRDSGDLVCGKDGFYHAFSKEELATFLHLLKPYFSRVELRGID